MSVHRLQVRRLDFYIIDSPKENAEHNKNSEFRGSPFVRSDQNSSLTKGTSCFTSKQELTHEKAFWMEKIIFLQLVLTEGITSYFPVFVPQMIGQSAEFGAFHMILKQHRCYFP